MRKTFSLAFGSTWLRCGQVEHHAHRTRPDLRKTKVTAGQLLTVAERAAVLCNYISNCDNQSWRSEAPLKSSRPSASCSSGRASLRAMVGGSRGPQRRVSKTQGQGRGLPVGGLRYGLPAGLPAAFVDQSRRWCCNPAAVHAEFRLGQHHQGEQLLQGIKQGCLLSSSRLTQITCRSRNICKGLVGPSWSWWLGISTTPA